MHFQSSTDLVIEMFSFTLFENKSRMRHKKMSDKKHTIAIKLSHKKLYTSKIFNKGQF